MKTILGLVVIVQLVAALGAFVTSNGIAAANLVAGAIVAGTGFAIVDRLEQVRDAIRRQSQPPPVTIPSAPPSVPLPLAEFDAAKTVDAMLEARTRRPIQTP